MATSNRIRALNRLPFDFQDGLKVGGVDVTALNQAGTPAGASLIGFTPVGGISATNVQAALTELGTEKAPLNSPSFTGSPLTTTANYDDNSTRIASTAFVRKSLGSNSGFTRSETSALTLDATNLGQTIYMVFAAGDQTVTLPTTSSCPVGSIIHFKSINPFQVIIKGAGSDVIVIESVPGVNTIRMKKGETLSLLCAGIGTWVAVQGTALLKYSTSSFGSSVASSGYQKLPSGLIMQWSNTVMNSATSLTAVAVTFPIAFPTAVLGVYTDVPGTNTALVNAYTNAISLTGFNSYATAPNAVSTYLAIGY